MTWITNRESSSGCYQELRYNSHFIIFILFIFKFVIMYVLLFYLFNYLFSQMKTEKHTIFSKAKYFMSVFACLFCFSQTCWQLSLWQKLAHLQHQPKVSNKPLAEFAMKMPGLMENIWRVQDTTLRARLFWRAGTSSQKESKQLKLLPNRVIMKPQERVWVRLYILYRCVNRKN